MPNYNHLKQVSAFFEQRQSPSTIKEAIQLIIEALRYVYPQSRCLFYLTEPKTKIDPLDLLPCPSKNLGKGAYIHRGHKSEVDIFRPQEAHIHINPLYLNKAQQIGFLFVEASESFSPLDEIFIGFLALYFSQQLSYIKQLIAVTEPAFDLNLSGQVLAVADTNIALTPQETRCLATLHQAKVNGATRHKLIQAIYAHETWTSEERDSRLDVLISKLRKKLKAQTGDKVQIETIRGVGYRLRIKAD